MTRSTMSLKTWINQRAMHERRYLTRFAIGATLFFGGAGGMLYAEHLILPSLQQEIVALIALLISGAGALAAASGYIMLLLIRIFRAPPRHD
ncbi:hypothetical protein [Thalassolituus sp.]|uniref:hypothetical protein n=2 Tax=Thalassolituus sp. TaxID=2030822 RepID=UPI003517538D